MVSAYLRSLYERSYGSNAQPPAASSAAAGAEASSDPNLDEIEDCYFCRISGFLVFGGTGAYCWDLARKARAGTADRRVYGGIGAIFMALAVFRAATPAGWRERRALAAEHTHNAKS